MPFIVGLLFCFSIQAETKQDNSTKPLTPDQNNKQTNESKNLSPKAPVEKNEKDSNLSKFKAIPLQDVQRFTTAISQIKSYYVEDVSDKVLFEDAIRGMLEGLDPHSSYLDEDEYKELYTNTQGEFGGLGIEVTMEESLVKVISPIDDTPAHKAGIKAGDFIVRINDEPVKGMKLKDAVNKMRGKKGSKITLTILREKEEKPLEFELLRDIIVINSVKSEMLDEGFLYIRLSHFQANTAHDFLKVIETTKQQSGVKGLILDVRNNPGGLLDSAIEISDAFIHNDQKGEEELIVYTKGRLPGSEFRAVAAPGDIIDGAPIVVLINEGSASGSEIVAGALKDNKRAILVGTKSFGKGSVQTILPLDEKRGIKLTTALYYTPSGRSIQAQGLEPDIVIEEIKMPKQEKKDEYSFLKLHESSLSGHLKNKNDEVSKEFKLTDNAKKLLENDYQLVEALNILKAMRLAVK